MKFAFYTLGCKVNLFETQALRQLCLEQGHKIVEEDADAVVINTCTVTSVSDHKNIRAFHKLRRNHPKAVIAACGCFAEKEPERVKKTGEVDIVCGTHDRKKVIKLCENAVKGLPSEKENEDNGFGFELLPAGIPEGRTRALLKIEDGCDNYCAYCIIPYARGHVRSITPEAAYNEASRLAKEGVKEIVLTGIEIASYGKDLGPGVSLVTMLKELLSSHPGVRFRLGSLDPRIADSDFCESLSGFDNLAKHFHLSLQSGCDSVLKRMGRHYTTEEFYKASERLRNAFPDCSITADVIVGFPGETEDEFHQTLKFMERCEFASVHVFPFSLRKGTKAAAMDGQLPKNVKADRAAKAKETAVSLSERYRERFTGREIIALPEHRTNGLWAAHGDYGFPIYIEGNDIKKNCPELVRVKGLRLDGVIAEIIQEV